MNNKDIICIAVIVAFLILIWTIMVKKPAIILDRKPPLPINLRSNGVLDGNTNDVTSRVNFQQQPYG